MYARPGSKTKTSVVTDPLAQADSLVHWRCGRIVMQSGKLVAIERRRMAITPSVLQVWFRSHYRGGQADRCVLDYHAASGGRFLILDYVRSGPATRLATFRGACRLLDEIARIRQAMVIVAHVSTTAISDRLLLRWGWQQHARHLSGRHWIKRFYDAYPEHDLRPYLVTASCDSSPLPRAARRS